MSKFDIEAELREAVHALTKPYTLRVPQVFDGVLKTAQVQHVSRLEQLRKSVHGTTGRNGHRSNEVGLPINQQAYELFDRVENTIFDWFIALANTPGSKLHLTPESALDAWFVAWLATKPDVKIELGVLRGWLGEIENLFDPAEVIELTVLDKVTRKPRAAECPDCACTHFVDKATKDQATALVLEYREIGKETVEQARVLCRACRTEWVGGSGIRAVAYELEQQQAVIDSQEGENGE